MKNTFKRSGAALISLVLLLVLAAVVVGAIVVGFVRGFYVKGGKRVLGRGGFCPRPARALPDK